MKIKTTIIIALTHIFFTSLRAQEIWDLTKCINYAVENNIDLKIKKNEVFSQQVNLFESKADLLPSLNLGSNVNINYGRNIDGNTNAITYNQTLSNSYWISSYVDLFQGFVKLNSIKFNKYLLSANKSESELIKNQLIFKIITSFYTLQFTESLEKVAQKQLRLSEIQYKRMQKLVDVGKETSLTLQDLKSRWIADKLSLTKATNQKNNKYLELKQLLRLSSNLEFKIDTFNNTFTISKIEKIDSIFNNAINFLPEIKQQELLLKASQKNLLISKGKISPRLFLSGGLYTNYFDGDNQIYFNQINNNQNQQIRLGLIIPVFNGASTYSDIKRKKIAINTQKLKIEKQKEQVLSEIQRISDNVISSEKEYNASVELLKFSKISFKNASIKLEKGLINIAEYELAKQGLFSAEVEILKSKLTYIMNSQILEYYKTGSWEHVN